MTWICDACWENIDELCVWTPCEHVFHELCFIAACNLPKHQCVCGADLLPFWGEVQGEDLSSEETLMSFSSDSSYTPPPFSIEDSSSVDASSDEEESLEDSLEESLEETEE